MLASPATARVETSAGAYMRARAAEALRMPGLAAVEYGQALVLDSSEPVLALRAYRSAVEIGDYALALRAAHVLDRSGLLPPDARVLLYIAAVRDRDWASARARLVGIEPDSGFAFVAPLLGAWLPDPPPSPVGLRQTAYRNEAEALHALAKGRVAEGSALVRSLWLTDRYRATSLAIVGAATLAARGDRQAALALLTADDASTRALRLEIARGVRPALAVDTAARAAGFVLSRMAGDLIVESGSRAAVTLARLATFADPGNARAALIAAGALSSAKRPELALATVTPILADPVYGDDAASLRIDLLEALARDDEALAAATERAGRTPNDRARLGDIEARRGNYRAASVHYATVLAATANPGGPLLVAAADASERAGDWPTARSLYRRALAMSPDDAGLLSRLGSGMARRGETLDEAIALLTRADAVQPSNAAIIDSLGYAELRRGRTARAIDLLERARALDGAGVGIAERLGDAYWASGRHIEARFAWSAAREGSGTDDAARLSGKLADGAP